MSKQALMMIGASAAGGLLPSLGMQPAADSVDFFKDHWWAYPGMMVALGGLIAWKGKPWMQPLGYALVGAGFFQGYQGYQAESSGAGNMYGLSPADAGNVFFPPNYAQDAGQLPPGYAPANPYAYDPRYAYAPQG